MRPKHGSKVKLCYMDTNSFVYKTGLKTFKRTLELMWRKGLIRVDIERIKTDHYPSKKIKR